MTSSLYNKTDFKDNCGFGLIAHQQGTPTHKLLKNSISALTSMTHRGGIASDGKTGDGCGLLVRIPDEFFRKIVPFQLPDLYAVGMIFFNQNPTLYNHAKQILSACLQSSNIEIVGWRNVPVNEQHLGPIAHKEQPTIEQVFLAPKHPMKQKLFETTLFVARRKIENALQHDNEFHICSFSSQVISYKGLMMPNDLPHYYSDLKNEEFKTSVCIFHQRFSTNTTPHWALAQPFRMLAHNGEINTIKGNRSWAEARQPLLTSQSCPEISSLSPIISQTGSDSYSLDNMLELLVHGGLTLFQALRLLIQPAWNNVASMTPGLKAFYDFNNIHSEAWDGPAGLVITDGRYAVCALDKNGLRPARWVLTQDKHLTVASEAGVLNYAEDEVVARGRVGAGEILALDTVTGELYQQHEIDNLLQKSYPYKKWVKSHVETLTPQMTFEESIIQACLPADLLTIWQKMFFVTTEEYQKIILVLAKNAQEPVSSMGDDTPIAVMSQKIRSPYDYFRQQFAQVTNPPMDSLRESLVMSLEIILGKYQNVFHRNKKKKTSHIKLSSPVLSASKHQALINHSEARLTSKTLSLNYQKSTSLDTAIKHLCHEAEVAVQEGTTILFLTDKAISSDTIPIHASFAVGAVHQHLIQKKLRGYTSLIVETATARDAHHFAVLLGVGANAIYPYLSYTLINQMVTAQKIKGTVTKACRDYRRGIKKGLLKIMSKMGISTLPSYIGAQLFETVGFSKEISSMCFHQLRSPISGATFSDFHEEQLYLAEEAWNPQKSLQPGGLSHYMHKAEFHAYHPDVVQTLQHAIASGDFKLYQKYSQIVNERTPAMIRDLLTLKHAPKAQPLETVEPVGDIVKRFDSAAMSLGALSPEAHESLAQAMNSLGGRSNSGEGGEDPARYNTDKVSKIKQVASGRFGVNAYYLVNAEVLQIKISQGAKPGEGGQLPGEKVNDLIARLRFSSPGVTLISPPPHHDIYSIEDLAQLIFDLKSVNPNAKVAVKLVSGPGIGTITAGVAKAYADIITISGHDGGTGASPISSIRYAGSPWEMGLAEAQQALVENNLRDKVILQTDGGLKTGLDVIKAALLGADSFGFGTAPMIALGCKYLRSCHLNNCATGVATQNTFLRNHHYSGTVEKAINFFMFVAEEVRIWLSILGFNSLSEIIGRTDLLKQIPGTTKKQRQIDLSALLGDTSKVKDNVRAYGHAINPPHDKAPLSGQIIQDCLPLLNRKETGEFHYTITNRDRSIGAKLGGEIARRYTKEKPLDIPIQLYFKGSAGQSFGVWNVEGQHLYLTGEANDYVGKGMTGGKIVISPEPKMCSMLTPPVICGNTCLYGATGGECFIAGTSGERFAIRNSGAHTVVEGVGDHCCEYMTSGCVTVLGNTGHNFGAGMTGGMAYVLDIERQFVDRHHQDSIDIKRISTEEMEEPRMYLYNILCKHIKETNSLWAKEILENFSDYIELFWLATPKVAKLPALMAQNHGRPE